MAFPAIIMLGTKVVSSALVRKGAVMAANFAWTEFKPAIREKLTREIIPNLTNAISEIWHNHNGKQISEPADPDLC